MSEKQNDTTERGLGGMRIICYSSVREATPARLRGKTVLVVDVLRATTTLITALGLGIPYVRTVPSEALARQLKRENNDLLIAGERDTHKITGFDFGNSPTEIVKTAPKEAMILLSTNGTRAIHRARLAQEILPFTFLNVTATARYIQKITELHLLLSGTKGYFSLDDGLVGGALLDRLSDFGVTLELDDLSDLMLTQYRKSKFQIAVALQQTRHGQQLTAEGFAEDVLWAAQEDLYDLIAAFDWPTQRITRISQRQ